MRKKAFDESYDFSTALGLSKARRKAVTNRLRDYGEVVLAERAPKVRNPNEAEMNAIVKDLRS